MRLFRELKRRKVLHTLSLYVVGCWVALQVVEVLSEAGLPPQTMRHLLIAMSAGFPFVLFAAWFYDISAEGVTRTPAAAPDEALPQPNLGDHALMAGLIAVIALNFYVLSSPPPDATPATGGPEQRTLVVMAFEDVGAKQSAEQVGQVIAAELRDEFTRVAGLKVLGAETSRAIQLAGDTRDEVATELGVTSILTGAVALNDGTLEFQVELVKLPVGNTIWRTETQGDVREGVELQESIVEGVLEAIMPSASASPSATHAPRIGPDECRDVYELYLRAKNANSRERRNELLREAVRVDADCSVAWEAIAVNSIDYTVEGFAKADAAARRALDLNDSLSEAWTVLAEIAEEKGDWGESEQHFLRALYVDPTDIRANMMYGEALMARGRGRDALRYSLEAYRYEPAASSNNWRVSLSAIYANEGDLAVKHSLNYKDLHTNPWYDGWIELAEGHLLAGRTEEAISILEDHPDVIPEWAIRCVRARNEPGLSAGLLEFLADVAAQVENDEIEVDVETVWQVFRCAMWLGENDLIFHLLDSGDHPTEQRWFAFFHPEAGALRQDPRFRQRVVDSGLLDYWREWGWADYCRPDGDSFVCD